MNILLILRAELMCAIILLGLFLYTIAYLKGNSTFLFFKMCLFALIHNIFDLITVYTVNHTDQVPFWLNKTFHILFFLSAILFCCEVLLYTIRKTVSIHYEVFLKKIIWVVIACYLAYAPFAEIRFVRGNGTGYSTGQAVYISYAFAFIVLTVSAVRLFIARRQVSVRIVATFLPVTLVMLACIIAQIFIPELLFTGEAITLVTLGIFISHENPTEEFRQKAYLDMNTGLKNKNCYLDDIAALSTKLLYSDNRKMKIAIMLCDLNNLKAVNDNIGHTAGDQYIREAALILQDCLRTADNVYRTGGDEFVAIYLNAEILNIELEMRDVRKACEKRNDGEKYPLTIAMGYACSTHEKNTLGELFSMADSNMYQNKQRMKGGR